MYNKLLATAFVAITSLNLVAAEPSAFGAGNLDNPNPYGLTSSEEAVLQNKTKLKKIVVRSNNQANEVESLRERIDGLQSIIESLSRKAQKNKRLLTQLTNKNNDNLKKSDEYGVRLGEIAEDNTKSITANMLLIDELGKLVSDINKSYISKTEFNVLVKDINEFKSFVSKELKRTSKKPAVVVNALDKMPNSEVDKKAKAFYDREYYTKGIEYYSHLILKNYKPANSHYMIGQMNFKRRNYAKAISFYKKSASLYSKASYMPELMLNTAISMDRTGDTKNAKAFYNGVSAKFPESPQAKKAQKYLKSL